MPDDLMRAMAELQMHSNTAAVHRPPRMSAAPTKYATAHGVKIVRWGLEVMTHLCTSAGKPCAGTWQ